MQVSTKHKTITFAVEFKVLVAVCILRKGQGVNQSPIKITIHASSKLVTLPLLQSPPSIGQWEVHGEEDLELTKHSLLPVDLSASLNYKLSPILELPERS